MRRWTGLRDNKEMAGTLVFFTYILKDLEERAGGNPFDNRNTIYDGTEDDNALNDGVVRYKSEPRAAAYLERYYTPTGHLTRPMLAIHTTYDPLVPPWIPNMYSTLAERAGSDPLFVQQYVKRGGHCAISPAEIVERTVYALVNEGAKILEEGIALRAVDIDIVYIYGYGFPVWRGGPMRTSWRSSRIRPTRTCSSRPWARTPATPRSSAPRPRPATAR